MGIASECLGTTRADLLENLVQQNKGTFSPDGEIEKLTQEINQLKQENQQLDWVWRGNLATPLVQSLHQEKSGLKAKIILNRDELNSLAEKVLKELRLGKQASSEKLVQKSLKRLIELILFSSK